jgi:hypothetical protein
MGVPGNASPLLLTSAAGAAAGYQISRSVRLNAPDSAYLSRTPGTAGNRKTWTWAGWVKLAAFSDSQPHIFGTDNDDNNRSGLFYATNSELQFYSRTSAVTNVNVTTVGLFRDYSAWYHIVLAVDTNQATPANVTKIYVNGVEQALTVSAGVQNALTQINNNVEHSIGRRLRFADRYLDGYLADIHFIDGQALDPTSFGEFDTNGVWQPKAFSGGSYGTTGFRLPFSDNSTAAALGTDTSGNGHTWTVNNISVTAGAGNDSLVDSPTNYGTDTGAGGEVRGNYATLNPLARGVNSSQITLSNGNLDALWSSSVGYAVAVGTIGVSSGKWYWEITHTQSGTRTMIGVVQASADLTSYIGTTGPAYDSFGYTWRNGVNTAATSYGVNDVVGIALDLDNGKIWFAKNGTWLGSGNPAGNSNSVYSSLSGTYFPAISEGDGNSPIGVTCNFGQRPFAYTAPSGFKALCTTNLPTPTIADGSTVMDVALYTGNGSTQTISGLNFSPDFLWIKSRSTAQDNNVFDAVRGVAGNYYALQTNATTAEGQYGTVSALTSDGFTLSNGGGATNFNGTSYVAWTWDAGSSTVTNTQGSITSQVRANASAGFSVVTYTAPSSGAWTTGHGLGVAPQFIITKSRSNTYVWGTYHVSIGNTGRLDLNSTNAVATTQNSAWNNTSPTSTVFSMGSDWAGSGITYVAYCFAPVAGYSSFGSYVGNGTTNDGTFVYLGFRPKFVMVKNSSSTGDWTIWDSVRDVDNVIDLRLRPSTSESETLLTNAFNNVDFLSNGFKLRGTAGSDSNSSGATYIYAAFAESPFQYARAR